MEDNKLYRRRQIPAGVQPLAVTIADAADLVGVGRTKIYKYVADGKLRLCKLGKRSVIPYADLEALVNGSVEAARPQDAA
jgi:excisionase family DNA binding protein